METELTRQYQRQLAEDNRTLSLENYKLRKRIEYLENELKKAKEKK